MRAISFKGVAFVTLLALAVVGFSACNEKQATVRIQGSETINARLARDWMNEFNRLHPGIVVTVMPTSTGKGFEALIKNECDIAAASRPPNDREKGGAQVSGFELETKEGGSEIGFVVGLDAIAVIVHQDNPLRHLTVKQLKEIFSGKDESGNDFTDWSQVKADSAQNRPPSGPIKLIIPSKDHGTHDFFKEKVLGKDGAFASSAEQINESSKIGARVAADPGAIGFVSLSSASPSKILRVKAAENTEAVMPSDRTISNEKYPITRRLYLYTRGVPQGAVKEFVDYALSDSGQKAVASNNFVNLLLPDDVQPGTAPTGEGRPETTRVPDNGEPIATIRFRPNSAVIQDVGNRFIEQIVRDYCPQATAREIELIGYTDSSGQNHLPLSRQRAQSVNNELGNRCPQLKVKSSGRGDQNPVDDNSKPEGRERNRRVEVYVR